MGLRSPGYCYCTLTPRKEGAVRLVAKMDGIVIVVATSENASGPRGVIAWRVSGVKWVYGNKSKLNKQFLTVCSVLRA